MTLKWIVVDLNSYFAHCEQQARPELRGKPVAVAPMMSERTCAIAANAMAKAHGIKTGTPISEAIQRCPGLMVVEARPQLYVETHNRILAAIDSVIPADDVMSVDEVACLLDRTQRTTEAARAIAVAIKAAIHSQVGEILTCSVGIASNRLLAKLASDMRKPDGLVMLLNEQMPQAILHLELRDICGIGANMEQRIHDAGIRTVAELWAADRHKLRRVWGGVVGSRFYAELHGIDLPRPKNPRRSIGHQHVLAPDVRTIKLSTPILQQLLARCAERLRRERFFAKRITLHIDWLGNNPSWRAERRFTETRETQSLMAITLILMQALASSRLKPLRIGVVLSDLVPEAAHQPDLFEKKQDGRLSTALDQITQRFGKGMVTLGAPPEDYRAMTPKIPFARVPGLDEY